jgi:predicted secreted protein
MVQPLWVRTNEEQMEGVYASVPDRPYLKRKMCAAFLLSLVITGIIVAVIDNGWVELHVQPLGF